MNKFIIVTGGTKGIGLAIAKKFAGEGFDVAICSRNSEQLKKVQQNLEKEFPKSKIFIYTVDLSQKVQVMDFIRYIKSLGKKVDVLINNAGLFVPGQVHNEEEGKLELMINTNLYSAYHITRGFVEDMKSKKSGHIFNICSTASIIPYENGGSYCISKFALLGMSKVLREELKEYRVKVTAILPGATFTASWEGSDLPEERFMKAEDVAEVVYNAYTLSDRAVVEEILIRPQLGDI